MIIRFLPVCLKTFQFYFLLNPKNPYYQYAFFLKTFPVSTLFLPEIHRIIYLGYVRGILVLNKLYRGCRETLTWPFLFTIIPYSYNSFLFIFFDQIV